MLWIRKGISTEVGAKYSLTISSSPMGSPPSDPSIIRPQDSSIPSSLIATSCFLCCSYSIPVEDNGGNIYDVIWYLFGAVSPKRVLFGGVFPIGCIFTLGSGWGSSYGLIISIFIDRIPTEVVNSIFGDFLYMRRVL